ncbi:hypothetical protein SAMD00023353_1302240 [Rosellinia necatrix]|uniref:Uncharacterized protein n=1 Tax=Rosellinia necatrix TaxID=77044 RepID=A0A1S8A6U9_ROSNE|nr:hypothetical protein SAMD00023353_1302240 [Rosellinia necatrix]
MTGICSASRGGKWTDSWAPRRKMAVAYGGIGREAKGKRIPYRQRRQEAQYAKTLRIQVLRERWDAHD